jgi:hypothetical protein
VALAAIIAVRPLARQSPVGFDWVVAFGYQRLLARRALGRPGAKGGRPSENLRHELEIAGMEGAERPGAEI